jgi:site-specific DNA recombinase
MARALIYCRISKDVAGEQPGVERQEFLCREVAEKRRLDVVDVLVDNDVSAYDRRKVRPRFERLVEALKAGEADAVVVYHVDHLYRHTSDLDRLVDVIEVAGAQVHTVSAGDIDLSTASGRLVARLLGAVAQGEVERTSERMKAKHDELARHGKTPGGRPPYGYRRVDDPSSPVQSSGRRRTTYVVDPVEKDVLLTIARRVREGASTLSVSRELDAAGHVTREGRPWHHATVRAVMVNPAVAGLRVHRREIAGPGDWEPIFERGEWEQLRAIVADPARKRTRAVKQYLLSGFVVNPIGERMNGSRDRYGRSIYATRPPLRDEDKGNHQSIQIGADLLEEAIVEAVLRATDNAAIPTGPTPDAAAAGRKVEALEAELNDLAELHGKGTISLQEWLAARTPLQDRLNEARRAMGAPPASDLRAIAEPGALRRAWPTLNMAARREALAALIDRITVKPSTRGRWATIDERIKVTWKARPGSAQRKIGCGISSPRVVFRFRCAAGD